MFKLLLLLMTICATSKRLTTSPTMTSKPDSTSYLLTQKSRESIKQTAFLYLSLSSVELSFAQPNKEEWKVNPLFSLLILSYLGLRLNAYYNNIIFILCIAYCTPIAFWSIFSAICVEQTWPSAHIFALVLHKWNIPANNNFNLLI